jgi:ankyrin repeat protein
VRILLEAGADVVATNENGNRALTWAREEGHTEIVDLLMKAGAEE